MALIAVDMTPVLPGGMNGGAKILAIELLKSFHEMAAHDQFLILTASWNHQDLAFLDGPNMRRICVLKGQEPVPEPFSRLYPGRFRRAMGKIGRHFKNASERRSPKSRSLSSQGVKLLFCPFTAPTYAQANIPTVSVVLDLQHRELPQFFSPHEIGLRNDFMSDLNRKADQIICISEYTRKSVLKHLGIPPERTHAVPICIQTRLSCPEKKKHLEYLAEFGISKRPYMFYPANFWPHKNHKMLLTAYGMLLARNPENPIDLVFTGALNGRESAIKQAVSQMGLTKRVHFLGFIPEEKLAAVWCSSEFLIFPSLYEGFGIPVLEAMSIGKPVLCSDGTSLPEVAGDAALYFDPRKPESLVNSIERITTDASLRKHLVEKGRVRADRFHANEMTRSYLNIFKKAMKNPNSRANEIAGIFPDGWVGNKTVFNYASGPSQRTLEIKLEAPSWLPNRRVKIRLANENKVLQKINIRPGKEIMIRQALSERQGKITISVTPTFKPSECGIGDDFRNLGLICRDCKLVLPNDDKILLR